MDLQAERERRGIAVLADQAQIGGEAQIAERTTGGGAERDAVDVGGVGALRHHERQVGGESQALGDHDREAAVQVDLIADQDAELFAVLVIMDERLVRPVDAEADAGAARAAQVERVAREPVAAGLGDVVTVEREAVVVGRDLGRGGLRGGELRQGGKGEEREQRSRAGIEAKTRHESRTPCRYRPLTAEGGS